MLTSEKLLKLILVLCGVACISGLPGLYIPRGWMAVSHEWLGMGRFPDPPIAIYGGLVLLMATDVRRYAPLITAQALMILALAASGFCYAWPIGIPKWWLLVDIIAVVSYCGVVLLVQRMIPPTKSTFD